MRKARKLIAEACLQEAVPQEINNLILHILRIPAKPGQIHENHDLLLVLEGAGLGQQFLHMAADEAYRHVFQIEGRHLQIDAEIPMGRQPAKFGKPLFHQLRILLWPRQNVGENPIQPVSHIRLQHRLLRQSQTDILSQVLQKRPVAGVKPAAAFHHQHPVGIMIVLKQVHAEAPRACDKIRIKESPLLLCQIRLPSALPALLIPLKDGVRIHQSRQLRPRVDDAGIANHEIIRRVYDNRIMEDPEAFIQHLLNAPLLVRQLIEAVVPFFIIIKDSLNLIKQQKRRGIVHQLEYLSVFPRISCPYFPDREQNRLFRHDQILLRHLIPGADIDPVILHLVPVAVVEDPLQMELIRQGLFILNREF